MSGLLDSKTRIYDTLVTVEGRGQISVGKLQADDSGKLFKFPGSTTKILNGQILLEVTGGEESGLTGKQFLPAQDNDFVSQATGVLGASIESFGKLYMIASPDIFDESRSQFILNINSA